MNEEKPKSIWKKPWKGPRGLLLWFVLLTIAAFIIFFAIGFTVESGSATNRITVVTINGIVVSIVFGLVGIFVVWFIRWLFHWRNFKRFLFGLACFATLIALFYAEEDWRGKHDWEQFKRQWEAKGERFDWQSIVPPSVSDNENFAFSPVWIAEDKFLFQNTPERSRAWYGNLIDSDEVSKITPLLYVSVSGLTGTNWESVHHLPNTPQAPSGWPVAETMDLKPWQNYYREVEKAYPAAGIPVTPQPQAPAQDVLLALNKFDPVIEQLRRDSARPYSRFPIQYNGGMPAAIILPHLAAEKRYAQVLQLRAIAELQNGESEKALADVKLMLRLTDASRNEPFLICHLVRIAILNLTLQPIWEGLAEHKWSDVQLADLDLELAKLDFPADCKFSMRGERNLEIANIEFLRHPHDLHFKRPRLYFLAPMLSLVQMLSNMSSDNGDDMPVFQTFALGMGPSGWLDQNELRLARFNTKWYLPVVDEETKTILPAKIRAADNALKQEIQHRTPENILETFFIPNWRNAAEKFAHGQSSTDMARVAIALERYRLAHGEFPESLAALTPKFITELPHDVINGEPLKYRRDPNGQFVLYSVGWNETDDGGVVVFKKGSTPDADISEGDWVWKYPAK